jgi:putative aldouronate transport system permease protein
MIRQGYLNTIYYVFVGTSLNVAMTSLSAYVLSRKGFYLKNVLMFYAVFTMFFSGGLIPYYLVVRSLGLADSRFSLIFPTALNTFNLIVMRTSFLAVPDSLEESATIDGAGHLTVLFSIILPLSLPVVAVMVLFYGVWHWNSWFQAMIFLRTRELYPLQLILREILIYSSTDTMITSVAAGDKEPVSETVKYATIIVATAPILIAYPFLQRYFIKGMLIGAIKE